ncbi:MAG: DUF6273 domain-containing protein, partial [Clostridia bacterium]
QPVTVKTLSSIAITTQPTKRAYKYGETFDAAGMVVTATYSDGSTAVVTGWTYAPTGALAHSDTVVTVSYTAGGTTKTATTAITIAKILSSIAITTAPTTTNYISGQTINTAGMVVTATYSDGSTAIVTGSCTHSPATASGSSYTVSYTYGGITKTAAQGISVVTPSATLGSNSWETISLVSAAGAADNFWNVGDEKPITLNGTTYTAQIIGFNHDNLSASDAKRGTSYNGGTNKAGITFGLKECLATQDDMNPTDNNYGGWDASEMRKSTLATTIYGYLDASIKSALRTVDKLATRGVQNSTMLTSADKLFLFAETEVFRNNFYSYNGEGVQYDYWKAGNSRIKRLNGSANWWWERSPRTNYSSGFAFVDGNGDAQSNTANSFAGVSFGFCV